MPDLTAREQLIRIATDPNAWPYQEQIEALLDAYERDIREQVAQDLLAVDPVDWALAGQHAGHDAARIARGTTAEETSR